MSLSHSTQQLTSDITLEDKHLKTNTAPEQTAVPATQSLTPGQKAQKAWLLALLATASVSFGLPSQAQSLKPAPVVQTVLAPAQQQFSVAEDAELESLSRIEHELAIVQRMVEDASKQTLPAQSVKFRYTWLIRDLKLMRDGIASHFDAERQPRPVPVLRGDYRQ